MKPAAIGAATLLIATIVAPTLASASTLGFGFRSKAPDETADVVTVEDAGPAYERVCGRKRIDIWTGYGYRQNEVKTCWFEPVY